MYPLRKDCLTYDKVLLRDTAVIVQQVDVLAAILRVLVPTICDILSYDSPILPSSVITSSLVRALSTC